MNSKFLLITSVFCLSMLNGCFEDTTDASTDENQNLVSAISCSTEPLNDNSGIKIICGGDSIGVVLNGKDGKDGADGKDGKDGENGKDGLSGKDGESCYVKKNTEQNGYDVFCGDEKLGFLANGKDGKDGTDGKDGVNGKDGKDGENGAQGEKGDKGDKGDAGEKGDKGDTGKQGETGAQGDQGEKGEKGDNGKDGKDGVDGKDGKDGQSCTVEDNTEIDGYNVICGDKVVGVLRNGKDGKDGVNGKDGKDGVDGKNGIDGKDGVDGKDGKDGKDGEFCTVKVNAEINGFDVMCGDEKVGELKNGKDGADGKDGKDGENGNDGSSCTVVENTEIDGYDVMCSDKKVGELRNGKDGKDAVLPSSSSVASSSSNTQSSSSEIASSSSVEESSSSEYVSSSSIEVSSSSEIVSSSSSEPIPSSSVTSSSSSSEPIPSSCSEASSSSSVEQLSEACKTLRATTDVFVSLYDVLGCTRSNEKVSIILRHAARDRNNYGKTGGLNATGQQQSKQVGQALRALNLDDFYYMHTDVKRSAETAMIISNNKGESTSQNISDWYDIKSNDYQNENTDLLESWYVKSSQKINDCRNGNSWGWSVYSKFAYEEYIVNGNDATQACKEALYDAQSRTQELVEKYFSYEKAHKYTLAISHDQFLVPFIIAISDKKIHEIRNGQTYDLRFHAHENEGEPAMFDYWINYLAGVVIITDGTSTIIIPVKALDDAFLHNY